MDETGSTTGTSHLRAQTATFLFCDMVGSTALLNRIGIGAADELRRRFNAALREAVRVTGGEEVKNLGDGLMVVFLHSARDAVDCAVAMQRGIDRLNLENPFLAVGVRVGVAVGEATYLTEEDDWFGPAVNTAARLCDKSRPGQILAPAVLVDLVGEPDLFADVGVFELKGLPRAVRTVEVGWTRDPPSSQTVPLDAALEERGGARLVGRVSELAELERCWSLAASRQTRAICITGEPGIGKTRLARELAVGAHRLGAIVLYARASAAHEHTMQPLADALRWYAASLPADELAADLGDLGPDLAELLPGLRYRLPFLDRRLVPPSQPADAPARLLRAACRRGPVLLILDDLHQAAPHLLRALAELTGEGELPLLVVGLFREDGPTWASAAKTMAAMPMRLEGLSVDAVGELVRSVVSSEVDDTVVASLHASTAGNPGHVLEVAHNLAAAGTVDTRVVRDVIEHTCPYRGLAPYAPADHALFFGRDELVGAILGRLTRARFLAVIGPSGSGKSSAVLAGAVPALGRGALPGSDTWPVVVVEPGSEPIVALAGAFAGRVEVADSTVAVERALAADPQALDLIARRLVDDVDQRVILVVDQFEEAFTSTDHVTRECFLDALLNAASVAGGPITLLIVLRADFYAQVASIAGLAPAIEANQILVGPLSTVELTAAVTQPAFVTGLRLEEGLVETIVRDAAGQPGALPLVSHALLETWRRRAGRTLSVEGYRDAGGVRAAVARSAEAAYEALDEDDRPRARGLFLRLVTLGEGSEDTRRRVPIGELPEPLARLVPPLVAARLVTADSDTVEVAHEALIREWPRLRAWLDEDRAALRLHRHLTQTAEAWHAAGHDPAELYSGARLNAALEWQKHARPELNDTEERFLDAGRRRQRLRSRRRRVLVGALAILTAVALAAAVLAVGQERRAVHNARETALKELVARSLLLRSSKRDLAALLAVAAYRAEPRADTLGAVLSTFTASPGFVGAVPLTAGSVAGALLPDGRTYAVLEADHAIHLVDLATRRDGVTLPPDERLADNVGAALSGDGRYLTMVGLDSTPRVLVEWDLTARVKRFPDQDLDVAVGALAVSPDGQLIAIGGGTPARIEIRSALDGSLIRAIPGAPPSDDALFRTNTTGLAFLPDGTLAFGSQQGPITIVDPHTGTQLRTLEGPEGTTDGLLRAAPDGRVLYGSGERGTFAWDLPSGQPRWTRPAPPGCNELSISPNTGALLCPRNDGRVRAYDTETGFDLGAQFDYQQGLASTADVSADGELLVETGGSSIALWRLDGGGPVAKVLPGSTGYTSLEFDRKGNLLATRFPGFVGEGSDVLDPSTGDVLDPLDGVLAAVTTTRADRLFASFADGTAGFYDTTTHARVPGVSIAVPYPYLAIPGGDPVLVKGLHEVEGVDVRTGELVPPVFHTDNNLLWVYATADGRHLFSSEFGSGLVARGREGAATSAKPFSDGSSAAISGDTMVVDSRNGRLRVLDPHSLRPKGRELPAITGTAHDLLLSLDGRRLMVVSADRTIRLADMATRSFIGDPIGMGEGDRVFGGEIAGVTAPALRSDGKALAFENTSGIVMWDLDAEHLVTGACQVASRNLTKAEWAENVGSLATYERLCPLQPPAR